uniref:YXWGXW repeat-containing protein n=1 Tax=Geobacter sp. (strain M21) TaxID=443144 RepID=C6E273_GEOSM
MKKHLAAAILIVLAGAASAQARMDVSVNIGVPVVVAPPPAATVVTYPSYPQPVAYAEPAGFIYSPNLGFYVSVGAPYDVVYLDNCYYRNRGGRWFMSRSYGGPWAYVTRERLPHRLHRHDYSQIRYYRDREYRAYLNDRDHYRGRWYRPASMHGHDRGGVRWGERRDRDRDGYRDREYARHDDRRDDRREGRDRR